MRTLSLNPGWLATAAAVLAISLALAFQRGSAQVGRASAIHAAASVQPMAIGQTGGSGSFVMDGDWFYILRGNKFYKVQKSTMSVFQTVDLN